MEENQGRVVGRLRGRSRGACAAASGAAKTVEDGRSGGGEVIRDHRKSRPCLVLGTLWVEE